MAGPSRQPSTLRRRALEWRTSGVDPRALRRDRWLVLRFGRLARQAAALRPEGAARSSLGNPAAPLLAAYTRHPRVAVLDVTCHSPADLRLLLGLIIEPAFRAGCELLIVADRAPGDLDPGAYVEPPWGCAWTAERLRYLASVYAVPASVRVPAVEPPWRRLARRLSRCGDTTPRLVPRLDPEQNAAVAAGDGVVQVIAPAGSGKTTVLVERVRELRRRGTAAERILCSTFNRDACVEIAARLEKAGIPGIGVHSFHGLGLRLLKEEGRLRGDLGTLGDGVWRDLAAAARAEHPRGGRLDAAAAQNAVSLFKLKLMITPDEARARAGALDPQSPGGARARLLARLYGLHEEHLRRADRLDFDDLIFAAIRLLQQDACVREKWQARYERVLVDEYQDIEPAQALLIGLLAAPHDSLFCVGDEDQCIYAWRRAAVQRVIELDQDYPGLERYPLVRNYRCGRDITHASRRLIRHNRQRFRKPLLAGVRERGRIRTWAQPEPAVVAGFAAALALEGLQAGGSVAVLSRTGRLLTAVAAAGGAPLAALVGAGTLELATVHGSKGREWDRVILVGADQGQFPLARTLRPGAGAGGGLEDERRLFYVALTRARRELDIVYTRGRGSQFLGEAGIKAR
ncbi:MAG: ATP-dependent helicase [bacterium]|nr:ATP-dependent helicase [bacterium]